MGLMIFLTVLLLFVDLCAWRIVRLPLGPFHLMRPFSTSALLVSGAGYIGVPIFRRLEMRALIRKEGPAKHLSKKGTPTMGGLLFVPIGVMVAEVIVGFSSIEVSGAACATLAFAAIGLFDDYLGLVKKQSNGLSAWIRILLEVLIFLASVIVQFVTSRVSMLCVSIRTKCKLLPFIGSCWSMVFLLVAYHGYIITLQHVYLLALIWSTLF